MIRRQFNPLLPLLFAFYGRFSDEGQNPRSPEQQWDTCNEKMNRLGYQWVYVKSYVDSAITGRLVRRRPKFAQMISDIRSGKLKVDLILVDTFERFGRADEVESIRRELAVRHGVLVLTADSHYSDPTSVAGKVLSSFESLRATEDNRVKAHNVLRGKRDAVRLKHWPGGPPPFGYKLKSIMIVKNGRDEVDYNVLVKDSATNWILVKLLNKAVESGWGSPRLTRFLDNDPEIPDEHKPFCVSTVNRWLSDEIYYGEFVWGEKCTDIVDDRRVIEPSDPADVIRVPDYCEATITKEMWDRIQAGRKVRCDRGRAARAAACGQPDKLLRAIAPGLALKYPLSGLIRCGHCNRSMVVMSSPEYVTTSGIAKRYVSYCCPAWHVGQCPNRASIPESWLREKVIDLLLLRLFGSD